MEKTPHPDDCPSCKMLKRVLGYYVENGLVKMTGTDPSGHVMFAMTPAGEKDAELDAFWGVYVDAMQHRAIIRRTNEMAEQIYAALEAHAQATAQPEKTH